MHFNHNTNIIQFTLTYIRKLIVIKNGAYIPLILYVVFVCFKISKVNLYLHVYNPIKKEAP